MKLLVVEDDIATKEYIKKGFEEQGYVVDTADSGTEALFMASEIQYDLIIIDRMLPKMDGLSVLKSIRATNSNVPVIVLSALGAVDERIEGLRAGGDDYLTKPFSLSELSLRVENLIRKSHATGTNDAVTTLMVEDLSMDLIGHKVMRNGQPISLQPKEFKLLKYLLENKNKVVSRTLLFEAVWDFHFDPKTNVIDVHIANLRKKLEEGQKSQLIYTVRGSGYVIREN